MNFLFDSHALLWLLFRPERMEVAARVRLEESASAPVISIASIWELEIKQATGKLDIELPNWLNLQEAGLLEVLPITIEDAIAAAALPLHHRDPFDRMIIAQATRRGLTILSRDRVFDIYGAPVLPC